MPDVTLKQKEGRTLKLMVKSQGQPLDVENATLTFGVKREITDNDYAIKKVNADIDKTEAANGIVRVVLSKDDLDLTNYDYVGELDVNFDNENAPKSGDISIRINRAVITD